MPAGEGVDRVLRFRFPRRFLLAGFLSLVVLPPPGAGARAEEAEEEETADAETWNQFGGNAGRTFWADVEPVIGMPRVAWKADLRIPDPEVVVSGGTVYAVGEKGRAITLAALSLADGTVLATRGLGKAGRTWIAASRGMAVTADPKGLRGWKIEGKSFIEAWQAKGSVETAPAVVDGRVVVGDGDLAGSYDPVTGKSEKREPIYTQCPLAHHGDVSAGAMTGRMEGQEGEQAYLKTGGGKQLVATFKRGSKGPEDFLVSRLSPPPPGPGGWFLFSRRPFAGYDGDAWSAVVPDPGGGWGRPPLTPLAHRPMIREGRAVGFTRTGTLVSVQVDGQFVEIIGAGRFPTGAFPGPATGARYAAHFGNWAVDLDGRRILWVLTDQPPLVRILPVADRFLVGVAEDGTLRGLTDRRN